MPAPRPSSPSSESCSNLSTEFSITCQLAGGKPFTAEVSASRESNTTGPDINGFRIPPAPYHAGHDRRQRSDEPGEITSPSKPLSSKRQLLPFPTTTQSSPEEAAEAHASGTQSWAATDWQVWVSQFGRFTGRAQAHRPLWQRGGGQESGKYFSPQQNTLQAHRCPRSKVSKVDYHSGGRARAAPSDSCASALLNSPSHQERRYCTCVYVQHTEPG